MSDEPRVLQAADVYNATHDLPLYEWVASLESQNQALQREVENKAAILNAIEALLDVDDEHTGWERIVALQERAEKAEAALKAYRCEGCGHPFQETAHIYGKRTCCPDCSHGRFIDALSPTQET